MVIKNVVLKELQEIFAEMITSKKNRKGVLEFSNKTKDKYTDFLTRFTSSNGELKSTFRMLPNRLPGLPNHFETWVSVLAFLCPLVFSIIFYLLQIDLFLATLISIGATPVCLLVFYILSKRALQKQDEIIRNLSRMIDLLKSK